MKLRHDAALALVGWYLMVPPPPIFKNDPTAKLPPLSQWEQRGLFDSVAECEHSKFAKSTPAHDNVKNTLDLSNPEMDAWFQYEVARCIATDDPRLKGK